MNSTTLTPFVFGFGTSARRGLPWLGLLLTSLVGLTACGEEYVNPIWTDPRWELTATVEPEHVRIAASIADVHGDFVHVSIRKEGHDNGYTPPAGPGPNKPWQDWSRVHRWFGDYYPNTYLEGRFDDGTFRGPPEFTSIEFQVPRARGPRANYPDENGTDFEYITIGYDYAGGINGHPGFGPGEYEIEIYAWYTGVPDDLHPAVDDSFDEVQYIHHEQRIITTRFTVPDP